MAPFAPRDQRVPVRGRRTHHRHPGGGGGAELPRVPARHALHHPVEATGGH